jgi:hypothetical protein
VKPSADFEVTVSGTDASWQQTDWTSIRRRLADGHP